MRRRLGGAGGALGRKACRARRAARPRRSVRAFRGRGRRGFASPQPGVWSSSAAARVCVPPAERAGGEGAGAARVCVPPAERAGGGGGGVGLRPPRRSVRAAAERAVPSAPAPQGRSGGRRACRGVVSRSARPLSRLPSCFASAFVRPPCLPVSSCNFAAAAARGRAPAGCSPGAASRPAGIPLDGGFLCSLKGTATDIVFSPGRS